MHIGGGDGVSGRCLSFTALGVYSSTLNLECRKLRVVKSRTPDLRLRHVQKHEETKRQKFEFALALRVECQSSLQVCFQDRKLVTLFANVWVNEKVEVTTVAEQTPLY